MVTKIQELLSTHRKGLENGSLGVIDTDKFSERFTTCPWIANVIQDPESGDSKYRGKNATRRVLCICTSGLWGGLNRCEVDGRQIEAGYVLVYAFVMRDLMFGKIGPDRWGGARC